MDLTYKSSYETDSPIRKDINNVINEPIGSREFDEFQQNLFEFYQFCMDSGEKLNDEIIKQSTLILNQMKDFLHQKYDFDLLHQSLQFIFELPKKIIESEYNELEYEYYLKCNILDLNGINFLDLQNFILSFVDFIYEFTRTSPDIVCYKFAATNYIDVLITILININSSIILFETANCFINLLDQKPLVSQYIPYKLYMYIYKRYEYYIIKTKQKKDILFDRKSENYKLHKILLKNALIEALCNFEIFLPYHYEKIIEENNDYNPSQIYYIITRIINSSLREDDKFPELKADFFFHIVEKLFHYANSSIISVYESKPFIKILNTFLGQNYNFKYDLQILFCFSKIAESSTTNAINIVTPEFCQYQPYRFKNQEDDYCDKRLIIAYCNLWTTIISDLSKPTKLFIARRKSIEILHKNVDPIIEMTSIILNRQKNDYDFEMIKATTLIHVALINSQDNDIVFKILTNLTDITDRIQQLIDEADPQNTISISKAIDVLYNFSISQGNLSFPDLFNWLQNKSLLESLSDVQSRLNEDGISCQELQNIIEKLKSIYSS